MSVAVGDRVRVSGGYDYPRWLRGLDGVTGTVKKWIPGGTGKQAAVVTLDDLLESEEPAHPGVVVGPARFLVLNLRWVGAQWDDWGVVHVAVCAAEPKDVGWVDPDVATWVESHATYEKISTDGDVTGGDPPA